MKSVQGWFRSVGRRCEVHYRLAMKHVLVDGGRGCCCVGYCCCACNEIQTDSVCIIVQTVM